MFEYDFMRTAFAACGVAGALAGFVGYFLVLRGQTFAGHALSHVGFTGATGAALFGISPLAGLIAFTWSRASPWVSSAKNSANATSRSA